MHKRFVATVMVGLMAVMTTAGPAYAQNPHFVGQIQVTDLGTTLQVSGSVAGLGHENIDVIVIAHGIAETQCRNPGGNIAPGQDTTIVVVGSAGNLETKNGRVNFSVTTAEPALTGNPCPNPRWTPEIVNVDFHSVTVQIIQPSGTGNVVLEQTIFL